MITDKQLSYIFIRHQVYLENYKIYQASTFASAVLAVLSKAIRELLYSLPVTTLNELPKKEFNKLIVKINRVQNPIIGNYVAEQRIDVKRLVRTEIRIMRSVLAFIADESGGIIDPSNMPPKVSLLNRILTSAYGDPIGATGTLYDEFVRQFQKKITTGIIDIVRKGYVNQATIPDTVKALVGTRSLNFRDGFFNKVKNWSKAVTRTSVQHVSSTALKEITKLWKKTIKATAKTISEVAIREISFERYLWVSVIDDVTTDICRSRDGNTYVYGEGPLPPAHINCRSTIVPLLSSDSKPNLPNYDEWLEEQALEFRNDVDVPITLDEFGEKVGIMIGA